MPTLIGIPILTLAIILQSAILSKITMLQASADLIFVVFVSWMIQERVKAVWQWAIMAAILFGFVSEVPIWGVLVGYLIVAGIGIALKRRVWRAPLLALFTTVFVGTLVMQIWIFVLLRIIGSVIDPLQAFNLVILPGILLNLLIAIPVNGLIREVANWFYPDDLEG